MENRVLPNGLKVILIDKPTKTATVLLAVKTGSNFENSAQRGVSHFIEHMLFEGTKNRTAIEITRTIEGIGGEIQAYTTNERTCFYIKVLPKHLTTALEILSDVANNPAFKVRSIEKERQVIINEINIKRDEPRFYQWELFLKALFQEHPTGNPIIGTKRSVKALDRKKIVEYYQQQYVPENMVLVYCGPKRDILRHIEKRFGEATPKGVKNTFSAAKPLRNQIKKVVTKDSAQSYFVKGYQTVSRSNKDSYVLDVIRAILGKGLSGRLVHEIRTKKGLAYEVGCHHEAAVGYGFFAIYLNTQKKNIQKCESIVKKQIAGLNSITPKELQEAKNFLEGEFVIEMEDNQKYADAAAFWDYCGLGVNVNDYITNFKKVTAREISRTAKKYFGNNYALVLLKQK